MPDVAAGTRARHIVDALIEERAPKLSATAIWPALRPVLYALLNYRDARAIADAIAPMAGAEALAWVSRRLQLKVEARGLAHVPERGSCVVVANHPSGIADGIAMYDVLRRRRRDLCFFANADAHRVCPGFDDVLIPVVWPPEARTMQSSKETLRMTRAALQNERAVVVFPAGGVARWRRGRVRDRPWEDTPLTLARKHGAEVVPAHLSGPVPWLFHLFDRLSAELRDVALFHELLNKRGKRYAVTFGPPLAPERLPTDAAAVDRLQTYVERVLPDRPDAQFA
ncbi:MAG: 1-acyl-sn-glycerol-3-phosphate acyltransferase [Alphaproteobacteria bacterium]